MTPANAERILPRFPDRRIAVVGDLMLDQFVWGTVDRISPEAPVPVVRTTRESFHLGGAGNVAHNIRALGGTPLPVGVIGEGAYADQLLGALKAEAIETSGVVRVAGRVTTVKTRVVAHSQQVVRFDREQDDPVDADVTRKLLDAVRAFLEGADAIVVSDYEKGCITAGLLEGCLPAAQALGIPVLIDPKPSIWRYYRPITICAPNVSEASRMSGVRVRGEEDLVEAGRVIREALGCPGVLITRGEKGMILLEEGRDPFAIAATAREVFDVTGAGDTVIATLAMSLAAGADLREAAALANAAAGVVVAKVGTAVATPAELRAAMSGVGR